MASVLLRMVREGFSDMLAESKRGEGSLPQWIMGSVSCKDISSPLNQSIYIQWNFKKYSSSNGEKLKHILKYDRNKNKNDAIKNNKMNMIE